MCVLALQDVLGCTSPEHQLQTILQTFVFPLKVAACHFLILKNNQMLFLQYNSPGLQ